MALLPQEPLHRASRLQQPLRAHQQHHAQYDDLLLRLYAGEGNGYADASAHNDG